MRVVIPSDGAIGLSARVKLSDVLQITVADRFRFQYYEGVSPLYNINIYIY